MNFAPCASPRTVWPRSGTRDTMAAPPPRATRRPSVSVHPLAEPYVADGDATSPHGRVGVLLSHGFTGSPASMRPWAEHLAAQGYAVSLPRLPGHGTTWQEMNRTTWADWYAEVERAFLALANQVDTVVVGGLSMGGALVLR